MCLGCLVALKIRTTTTTTTTTEHHCGLGGLVVSALDFQAGYRRFESRSGRDNFQIISTPSSYSTCPGLSIKWTGRRLVTDSGTKCAWVIHESKAVQIKIAAASMCLGCLVALKICTTTTTEYHFHNEIIGRHTSKWCCGGNHIQDGDQDADREKHRQISHGLAGIQRVGVGDRRTPLEV